jgi:WD40 repeat protein
MAPEQARGEVVDQRADVYAIGAMLRELCTVDKAGELRRLLRDNRIDRDLSSIVETALAADPARRYANAAALAADLKAFKAGTPITARAYPLPALLLHWMRRHRTLTASVLTFTLFAIFGICVYVISVASALQRTERAKAAVVLERAELLLHMDATAALAAIAPFRGNNLRVRRLRAQARGIGVASHSFDPHSDSVRFVRGRGDEILSLGEDGRIQRTSLATGISTLIASNGTADISFAYQPTHDLLAYTTSPIGVTVLRDHTRSVIPDLHALDVRFSADGDRLAAVTDHGELVVWSTTGAPREQFRTQIAHASDLLFAAPDRIVVRAGATLSAVTLDPAAAPITATVDDLTSFDARADLTVAGNKTGTLSLLSATLQPLATLGLCHARVNSVQFVPGTDALAFACADGYAGVLRFDAARHLTVDDTFAIRGSTYAATEPTGRFIMVKDDSHAGFLYDMTTHILHRYDGSAGQLITITPPTADFPHVLTGDANGTIRVWDPPTTNTHVALRAPTPLFSLKLSPDHKTLITNGALATAWGLDLDTGAAFELAHGDGLTGARFAPDGSSIVTYSASGSVRVWRARDHALLRSFKPHRGELGRADYLDPQHLVSVGSDGRVLAWSPDGADVTELFHAPTALRRLEIVDHRVVVFDDQGAVWTVGLDRSVRKVRLADGAAITVLRASRDGTLVAIGTAAGQVTVYATATWQLTRALTLDGGIRQLAFDPLDRDLLIASEARVQNPGHVHLLALDARRTSAWTDTIVSVRDLAYSPDGDVIGFVSADGGTWLYSLRHDTWLYANDDHTDTLTAAFSADGRWFFSSDRRGVVIARDVPASFASAHRD